ncbi:integrase [Pararobbsia alpina]|uniref:tyrosine-type recombinase/integrase n=1 Tax=Pararobbsia alpina TaxID=621374 RepID=UPI0039A5D3D3
MGRNKPIEGVYAREASILISFQWNGGKEGQRNRQFRERIALAPTAPNLRAAERTREDIVSAIRFGKFTVKDFARIFPDSPWLKRHGKPAGDTFKAVREAWSKVAESQLEPTTFKEYSRALERYFSIWDDREIAGISFEEMSAYIAGLGIKSPKTFNNIMTPLRRVYAYARQAKKVTDDITEGIDSRRIQVAAPDPLSHEEIEAVLAFIAREYDERWLNYFEFAFFTGLRPSEQIALRWPSVDFRSQKVRIEAARVRAIDKGTKTHRVRDIDVQTRASDALTRQKKHTFMDTESGFVFHNPNSGDRLFNTDAPLIVWHSVLRRLGIRDRDARQTRHSFATLCLHAGMNPAYVAKQMGNSPKMFFEVYSTWIEGEASQREKAKMDALLSRESRKHGS